MPEQIWKLQCLAILLQGEYWNQNIKATLLWKYQGDNVVGQFQVFDLLTVAALIDGQVLCVHGGLSPDIRTLDQVSSKCSHLVKQGRSFRFTPDYLYSYIW